MRSNVASGAVAGMAGGIVFGVLMQMMSAPTPEGGQMPMMEMVAKVVGSSGIAVGWLYHLFNSAVIGALFGALLGRRISGVGSGIAWGVAYGTSWWFLGALILMPVVLGMAPFSPLTMEPMRPVAIGSLMGHVIYGLILGAVFAVSHGKSQVSLAKA
ncbi:MAG: DUF6789 family protein [Bryobacteraceae bacterium]